MGIKRKSNSVSKDVKLSESKNKIDIILKIDNLKMIRENCLLKGELREALVVEEQIIKLADQAGLESTLLEEKEKVKELSQKYLRKQDIEKVSKMCEGIIEEFDHLVSLGNILSAHNIVQQFFKLNEGIENLESIEIVQELIKRDTREWTKYKVEHNI
ncbi:MAG: hypothetical protein BAJALOKI1v1_450021 [Promethearchaeota archaeon]|nr:MAG: hypothetical protein BAJALOKI1v1_450021 [Candidatus Lokiarchaeota archaeon]